MGRIRLLIILGLCGFSVSGSASKVREYWAFGWDPHPQVTEVSYFELELDRDLVKWKTVKVVGGTAISIRDVFVSVSESGNFSAVLRACRANGECSANSNRVVLDRLVPVAPQSVIHQQ